MTKPAETDQQSIHAIIKKWAQAIEDKDPAAITAHYTADTVLFDAIPPYKTIGQADIRQAWEDCLPYFPDQFTTDISDVHVHVSGDVAWAHFLMHFSTSTPDHPCGQTWMRVSAGYQRQAGSWVASHEHVSVPFNPMNNQAWFIKDPAKVDVPDYGNEAPCGDDTHVENKS